MEKKLILKRFYQDDKTTLGCLTSDKLPFPLFTCEKAWNNNEPYVSCIPSGEYVIKPHISPKFGKTLLVENVLNRTDILFHPFNYSFESEGCIAPGMQATTPPGVLNSRQGLKILTDLILDEWKLIIFPYD